MINIRNKHDCCGCSACVSRCPKQCINMCEDSKGFLYPQVDKESCIDCGICEKVCPMLNKPEAKEPQHEYAVQNSNEKVRITSSSGGVFSSIATGVLNEGGVVFGAAFDEEWKVCHIGIDTKEELSLLQGSKYVQSHIGDAFPRVEQLLKRGVKVLFSGTPCQIAGLKRYLRKEYNNLFTVDVICHGVPSPKVWREYLKSLARSENVLSKNSVLPPTSPTEGRTKIRFCSLNAIFSTTLR